jgi:hypothetical protein
MLRSIRLPCTLAGLLAIRTPGALAQAPNPVTSAFREAARDVADRIRLAVGAMPADEFATKSDSHWLSFGNTLATLGSRTYYLCSQISGAETPARADEDPPESKD